MRCQCLWVMKLESNEREKIGSLHWLGSSIDHSTCGLVFSLLVFGYLRFSGLDCVQYLLEDLIASGPAKKFCAGHPSPVASTQLNCSKDFKLFKVLFASYLPALVSHPLPVDLSFARAWAAQLSPEAPVSSHLACPFWGTLGRRCSNYLVGSCTRFMVITT